MRDQNKSINISWKSVKLQGKDSFLKQMKDMISDDIPICILNSSSRPSINIYKAIESGNGPHYILKDNIDSVHGHWMTVTGIIIDEVEGKTKLIISNWGEKHVIDYEEFYSSGLLNGKDFWSGIIYIEK